MPDDAHQETPMLTCTVCGEPSALESSIAQGICLDCYFWNFAGERPSGDPSQEHGAHTRTARQRAARRQWANREDA